MLPQPILDPQRPLSIALLLRMPDNKILLQCNISAVQHLRSLILGRWVDGDHGAQRHQQPLAEGVLAGHLLLAFCRCICCPVADLWIPVFSGHWTCFSSQQCPMWAFGAAVNSALEVANSLLSLGGKL